MQRWTGIPLLALGLALAPAMEAKEGTKNQQGKRPAKEAQKPATEKTDERARLAIPRRTEGHRPHDLDGDGVITRKEWPGDDNSFNKLDRNRDGRISEYDHELEPGQPKKSKR